MSRVCLAVAACLVLASAAAFADPPQMSVTVQVVKVRATPSALGKIVGSLAYGDRVTVLDQPAGRRRRGARSACRRKASRDG